MTETNKITVLEAVSLMDTLHVAHRKVIECRLKLSELKHNPAGDLTEQLVEASSVEVDQADDEYYEALKNVEDALVTAALR